MSNKDTTAMDEFQNQDSETMDVPQGGDTIDNSYASSKDEPVPVLKDSEPVEQPNDERNPDSDEALGKFLPLTQRSVSRLLSHDE